LSFFFIERYNNSIHEEALNVEHLTADPYPEPVEGEEGVEEEEAEPVEETEEGSADPEAEAAVAPKKQLKIWDANSVEVKGVLAVDTMGTGRPFTTEEETFVQRAAAAVSTFLERMTKHQYQAEVVLQRARIASNALIADGAEARAEENAAALESEMAALQSGNDSAPAEEGAAEGEAPAEEAPAEEAPAEEAPAEEATVEMSDEEKAKHSTRIKFNQATTFVTSLSNDLSNVLSQLCAPTSGVVDVIATCVEFVGIDVTSFKDKTTNVINWPSVCSGTNVENVLNNLKELNGDSFVGEACVTWRERLSGLDAGDYSAAVSALLSSALALLDHCDACEVIRAAEEAKRIAAEEAAAAAAEAEAAAEEEGGDE
jgi:hypothetical protein